MLPTQKKITLLLSKMKIIKAFFILIIILLSNIYVFSQEDILSKKISIKTENQTTKNTLKIIEQKTSAKFSYNSEIIDIEKKVSLDAQNIKISDCLDLIFQKKLKYVVAGNHIILLQKEQKKQASKTVKKQKYIISGFVKDSKTGFPIENASIYDVNDQYFSLTNQSGKYSMEIIETEKFRGINFGKIGYFDTVVVFKARANYNLDISLNPIPKIEKSENDKKNIDTLKIEDPKIESKPILVSKTLNDRNIVKKLVPTSTIIHSENLGHIELIKPFQISFLPKIGTNLNADGITYNRFSINILAGYSKGVMGVEIGSLFNIVRKDVSGIQLSGFTNIVGNKVNGVQMAGFLNLNLGQTNALQTAGFSNINIGNFNGIQMAGFNNIAVKTANGIQLSGISNFVTGNINGLQISGFSNIGLKNVNGIQIAGFHNFTLKNVNGMQVVGFVNNGMAKVNGIQIAGFANYAGNLRGLQIAPFNFSDTSSGVSIGVFNYVRRGYRQLEFGANQTFQSNIKIRTGIRRFYNVYNFSATATDNYSYSYGLGFGTSIKIYKILYFNIEATQNTLFFNEWFSSTPYFYQSILPFFQLQFAKHFAVNIGLDFNNHIGINTDKKYLDYISNLSHFNFHQNIENKIITQNWYSLNIGISF